MTFRNWLARWSAFLRSASTTKCSRRKLPARFPHFQSPCAEHLESRLVLTAIVTDPAHFIFASTDVPKPTQPYSTVESSITVANTNLTISSLTVTLDISHNYYEIDDISLISPHGTTIDLATLDDYIHYGADISFDDYATASIRGVSYPYYDEYPSGSYKSNIPLSDLASEPIDGTWRLQISSSAYSYDTDEETNEILTSELNSWSISFFPFVTDGVFVNRFGVLEYRGGSSSNEIMVSQDPSTQDLIISDAASELTALAGVRSADHHTVTVPISLVTSQKLTLDAGAGDDFLQINDVSLAVSVIGGDGNDTIFAQNLNRAAIIQGGNGSDSINCGAGDDRIDGGLGSDAINGGAGNDSISAGAGDDILNGADGNDTINANEGNDIIRGAAGNDILNGDLGDDKLFGGIGDDQLDDRSGANTLHGNSGNDTITISSDGNQIDAGAGRNDRLVVPTSSLNVTLTDAEIIGLGATATTSQVLPSNLEAIEISSTDFSFNNIVFDASSVTYRSVTLRGGNGGDILKGGHQGDLLDGGNGNDKLYGSSGDDTVIGRDGNDRLFGNAGDDLLAGSFGVDSFRGGTGIDVLSEVSNADRVTITDTAIDTYGRDYYYTLLRNTHEELPPDIEAISIQSSFSSIAYGPDQLFDASTVTTRSVTLIGGSGSDIIRGGSRDDSLDGGGGKDWIVGNGGNDQILGGLGDDLVQAGDGADSILGDLGNDLVDGGNGPDTINGQAGADTLLGGLGDDRITGASDSDILLGGRGDDILNGGPGIDSLLGEEGADRITGGSDQDHLTGNGNSTLTNAGDILADATTGEIDDTLAFDAPGALIAAGIVDDYGDTVADATRITIGSQISVNLGFGDQDAFVFSANAGDVIRASVTRGTLAAFTYLSIVAPDGSVLKALYDDSVAFRLPSSGDFVLKIGDISSRQVGTFHIATIAIADPQGETAATAEPITSGTPIGAGLDYPRDTDVFAATVTDGHGLLIQLQKDTLAGDPSIEIYNSSNRYVTASSYYTPTIATLPLGTPPGQYFIFISSRYSSPTGSYRLSVTDIIDDHGNTADAATSIANDVSVTGRIQSYYDVDLFRLNVTANAAYEFHLGKEEFSNTRLASIKTLSGGNVRFYYDYDSASYLAAASADETWILSVSGGYDPYSSGIGAAYELLTTRTVDDYGNSQETATTISPETDVTGNLHLGNDIDVFRLSALAGTHFLVSLSPADDLGYSLLRARDSAGNLIGTSYSGGEVYVDSDFDRDVYLTVSSYYNDRGSYTLRATSITDDHGNNNETSDRLTVATPVDLNFEYPDDVDVFQFNATQGVAYEFVASQADGIDDATMTITNASGTVLSSHLGRAGFKATGTETVYVAVSSPTHQLGAHSLEVNTVVDDHGDGFRVATELSLGDFVIGGLDFSGDRDVFSFGVHAGRLIQIPYFLLTLDRANIKVFNNAREVVTSNEETTGPLGFKAESSGIYFVTVSDFFGGIGTYRLRVREINDDFGNSVATAAALAESTPVLGRIHYVGDVDVFHVSVTTGTAYSIRVSNSNFTPALALLNSDGSESDIDGVVSEEIVDSISYFVLTFIAPNTGRLLVKIGADATGNDALLYGSYEIRIVSAS